MNFRLDHLLAQLRDNTSDILAAIDRDPLLGKRQVAGLVLANARQTLFTPQEEHQLYAKGIVYQREPYRLISLPLIKIYNLGEHSVTAGDLADLIPTEASATGARCHFLRKFDGTLIQRFQHEGQVWLTTRGMIEGALGEPVEDETRSFDYLGAARAIALENHPNILKPLPELDGVTLVFELIHPESRVITDYGPREELVLLAAFDCNRWHYLTYAALCRLADELGLTPVDDLEPGGDTLAAQIDSLLASLAGTDQEGSVINFERDGQVIYRVKVKSPDYLRVLRLMVNCTYSATQEILDTHPEISSWPEFERYLQSKGKDAVPEELLRYYEEHYHTYIAYLADIDHLGAWAIRTTEAIQTSLDVDRSDLRAVRKAFAAIAVGKPQRPLLFLAFDGRADRIRVRQCLPTPADAIKAKEEVGSDPV